MRRTDRERDGAFALEVFRTAPYWTVSFAGEPYAVPLSGAERDGALYFHCAKEGRKLDCLRKDPRVCVTAVSSCRPLAGKFTMAYSSAAAFGTAVFVSDPDEKTAALRAICLRYAPEADAEPVLARSAAATEVIRVDPIRLTGKCNPDPEVRDE